MEHNHRNTVNCGTFIVTMNVNMLELPGKGGEGQGAYNIPQISSQQVITV
jgi:hypothetical protein